MGVGFNREFTTNYLDTGLLGNINLTPETLKLKNNIDRCAWRYESGKRRKPRKRKEKIITCEA